MKYIFTLLVICFLAKSLFSQNISVSVIEKDGTSVNLGASNTINVLAKQEFYVKITLTEPISDSSAFIYSETDLREIEFIAPNGFLNYTQTDIAFYNYETEGGTSTDVNNFDPSNLFSYFYVNPNDTLRQYFTINSGGISRDPSLARNCIPCVFSKLLTKA